MNKISLNPLETSGFTGNLLMDVRPEIIPHRVIFRANFEGDVNVYAMELKKSRESVFISQ